jgi:photosystem II stability/assembly factor-like uncharacterized protein
MATTYNHLKKGESLANKQLVMINSDERDNAIQNTSSFTYTFNEPVERISKIDILNTSIPRSYYNVNNDTATMEITTETFTETITVPLVIDDTELQNGVIQATNILDGTVIATNSTTSALGDASSSQVVTKDTNIFVAGRYANSIIDFKETTGGTSEQKISPSGSSDMYVAKYTIEQELLLRFRISGILDDYSLNMSISDTDIYISGTVLSTPLTFYNADDTVASTITSDGNPSGFLARYTIDGIFVWGLKVIGTAESDTANINIIDDTNGYLYLSGTYDRDLEIYDIAESKTPIAIITAGSTPEVFLAQFDLDGTFLWASKITDNCSVKSMVMNTNTSQPLLGIVFSGTLIFYDSAAVTLPGNDLANDGDSNIALVEYDAMGTLVNRIKIGGTSSDTDVSISITGTTMSVTGLFTSNPVRFYNTLDTSQNSLSSLGTFNAVFIAQYDISDPLDKLILWATDIYTLDSDMSGVVNSITSTMETALICDYTSTVKFSDSSGYRDDQDLLNTSGDSYMFMAKYDNTGVLTQRSYIEVGSGGSALGSSIDAKSNSIYVAGSLLSATSSLYNSDNTLAKEITGGGTFAEGVLISYVNNVNNYIIDNSTLNNRIICRARTGIDLSYTLNLNSFSQQLGISVSTEFYATVFGSAISWTTLDITGANDLLTITFNLGNRDTNLFETVVANFTILQTTGYTPYNLASELNKTVSQVMSQSVNLPTQPSGLTNVTYDDSKNLFYIIFDIDGDFVIEPTALSGTAGLNMPNSISPHCIITDVTDENVGDVNINDTSKISIKLTESTPVIRFNNVDFSTAFTATANSSGVLNTSAILGQSVNFISGSSADSLSTDLLVNDAVTFDAPWIPVDKNNDAFLKSIKWTDIAISDDGMTATAVASRTVIYTTSNGGFSWVARETARDWKSVAMSGDGVMQTAVVQNGTIFISSNSGVTWSSRESPRAWSGVAVSRTDGSVQIACVFGGGVYSSTDSGNNWIKYDTLPDDLWTALDISADGSVQTMVGANTFIYNSVDSGTIFATVGPAVRGKYSSISMSDDGSIQTAVLNDINNGLILRSSDSGATWSITVVDYSRELVKVAVSGTDGSVQSIIGDTGDIYVSIDSGATWEVNGFSESFSGIALSSDGATQLSVVRGNGFYKTTNTGGGWIALVSPGYTTRNLAISSDAQYQIVGNVFRQLFLSTDFGSTFVKTTSSNTARPAMSSSGKYMYAGNGTKFKRSTDFGTTWTSTSIGFGIKSIATSTTGQHVTIASSSTSNNLYVSNDYGITFTDKTFETGEIFDVVMSSDGRVQIISINGSGVWKSTDFWNTSTKIFSSRTYLSISYDGNLIMVINGTDINKSIDQGITWSSPIPSGVTGAINGIDISYDGKNQILFDNSGSVFTSNDFGDNWKLVDITRSWNNVAMSDDGINAVAVDSSDILQSTNSGDSWKKVIFVPGNSIIPSILTSISTSNDGKYITKTTFNLDNDSSGISVSDNYGLSFKLADELTNQVLASDMSSDGGVQVASTLLSGCWVSIDYGSSWSQVTNGVGSATWNNAHVAADGSSIVLSTVLKEGVSTVAPIIRSVPPFTVFTDDGIDTSITIVYSCISNDAVIGYACGSDNKVYKTINSGATWAVFPPFNTINGTSIACSSDGSIVTISLASNGGVIVSTNAGTIYSSAIGPGFSFSNLRMSADGSTHIGVSGSATMLGTVYTSNDNWTTWQTNHAVSTWSGLDMPKDNKDVYIVGSSTGLILQSINFGSTNATDVAFNSIQYDKQPLAVSMSNDGSVQTIASNGQYLYLSSNTGNSWDISPITNTWQSIAVSGTDGSVQLAAPYNGELYVSTDSGATWANPAPSATRWSDVAISDDGVYQTATANIDIYVSSDSGGTWALSQPGIGIGASFESVAMSNDGELQVAVANSSAQDGRIFISTDFGATWVLSAFLFAQCRAVAVSSGGLVTDRTITVVGFDTRIYLSVDSGVTWTEHYTERTWRDVAMSDDGVVQTAVAENDFIYVSLDSGASWSPKADVRDWVSIGMSSDGVIQTAVDRNNYVYTSFDTGENWFGDIDFNEFTSVDMSSDTSIILAGKEASQLALSVDAGVNWSFVADINNWRGVAVSADATLQTAVADGALIYTSADSGATWTTVDSARAWRGVAMISTGVIQTAFTDAGTLYVSIDSGATWASRGPVAAWTGVALSADGIKQSATTRDGAIYTSTDSGTTWAAFANSPIQNWSGIAVSNTYATQAATAYGGQIYVSIDSGVAWTAYDEDRNWTSVSISGDGANQIATVSDGLVYSSTDFGKTWLSSRSDSLYRDVKITTDGSKQVLCTESQILVHEFELNSRLTFNIELVDSDPAVRDVAFTDVATTDQLDILHEFNLANASNFTIKSGATDIFVPPSNYTPCMLVSTINNLVTDANPDYLNAFSYDPVSQKFSFTPGFSGGGAIELTGLLESMGFTELPNTFSEGTPIQAQGIATAALSGPMNLFIRSTTLGELRKTATPFATNRQLRNVIAPLELNDAGTTFRLPVIVELYLNKKENIKTLDLQIVDQAGNIVNLNNGAIQINFYFYTT